MFDFERGRNRHSLWRSHTFERGRKRHSLWLFGSAPCVHIEVQKELIEDAMGPLAQHRLCDRVWMNCVSNSYQAPNEIFIRVRPPVGWIPKLHRLEDQVLKKMQLWSQFPGLEMLRKTPVREPTIDRRELGAEGLKLLLHGAAHIQAFTLHDLVETIQQLTRSKSESIVQAPVRVVKVSEL